ncbi:hypothetical protein [Marinilactibacillus psychrotolerans]|nr:hypothetical protein [Marinilactibacillus psychrotolerans]
MKKLFKTAIAITAMVVAVMAKSERKPFIKSEKVKIYPNGKYIFNP